MKADTTTGRRRRRHRKPRDTWEDRGRKGKGGDWNNTKQQTGKPASNDDDTRLTCSLELLIYPSRHGAMVRVGLESLGFSFVSPPSPS